MARATLASLQTQVGELKAQLALREADISDQAAYIGELNKYIDGLLAAPVVIAPIKVQPKTTVTQYTDRAGLVWEKVRTGNRATLHRVTE